VEATMSELDRRTGVKRLRVRGFKAVRFSATLKAIGINLFRAAAVPRQQFMTMQTLVRLNPRQIMLFSLSKNILGGFLVL
jgi:hypothetical protein